MKKRKNVYWDWKALQWRRGKKPVGKAKRKKASVQKKHAKMIAQDSRARARKESGQLFRQMRSEAKKEARGRELAKSDEALWKELYGSENPRRVFPGRLTASERAALRKLVGAMKKRRRGRNASSSHEGTETSTSTGGGYDSETGGAATGGASTSTGGAAGGGTTTITISGDGAVTRGKNPRTKNGKKPPVVITINSGGTSGDSRASSERAESGMRKRNPRGTMAGKKRKRKKNRSGKGKMPAGLARWHREQKRKKNARKTKRRKRANPKKRRRVRRRKPVARRVRRRKPNTRRRRRALKSNPRRGTLKVPTGVGKGTKAMRAWKRLAKLAYPNATIRTV